MQRETYITEVLRQHLQDGNQTYRNISKITSNSILSAVRNEIATLTSGTLPLNEAKYFADSLWTTEDSFRDSVFYGMPKVHKNKIPMPFRPVVSQCGSVFDVISIFADFKLHKEPSSNLDTIKT